MNTQNDFFQNNYDRIFSVVLLWDIGQPFVCGTLEKVVEYALKPNNGISHFIELTNGYKKVSKKDLKAMLERQNKEMSIELFSRF